MQVEMLLVARTRAALKAVLLTSGQPQHARRANSKGLGVRHVRAVLDVHTRRGRVVDGVALGPKCFQPPLTSTVPVFEHPSFALLALPSPLALPDGHCRVLPEEVRQGATRESIKQANTEL